MKSIHNRSFYIVNGITVYRLLAAPVLFFLIFNNDAILFGWLLAISFSTDAIDGYLARKFKVISVLGARLDSIADDLTIFAAVAGVFVLKGSFIRDQVMLVIILLSLYVLQNILALIRYRSISSFHTYIAKAAAILQAAFLVLIFLLPHPVYSLFYIASFFTIIDLIEEIILVMIIPEWQMNVKGLYWVLKKKNKE